MPHWWQSCDKDIGFPLPVPVPLSLGVDVSPPGLRGARSEPGNQVVKTRECLVRQRALEEAVSLHPWTPPLSAQVWEHVAPSVLRFIMIYPWLIIPTTLPIFGGQGRQGLAHTSRTRASTPDKGQRPRTRASVPRTRASVPRTRASVPDTGQRPPTRASAPRHGPAYTKPSYFIMRRGLIRIFGVMVL